MTRRQKLSILAAVFGTVAAVASGVELVGQVRLVDVVTLFAGAFGAGAGVVGAITPAWPERDRSQ